VLTVVQDDGSDETRFALDHFFRLGSQWYCFGGDLPVLEFLPSSLGWRLLESWDAIRDDGFVVVDITRSMGVGKAE
jgi:hypothetical protein